ncbi:MAG: ATP-dependent RNA helicase DbpA [Gammaproteobacteria bacterium]|nr:ATP-dependent RNA helicase DbpA [Gammaproteobacteria bacterium]
MASFSTLPLSDEFLTNLNSLDYKEMTPVQAQSIPLVLEGKDIRAQAKTGSGKTAAFGIGLLHKLDSKSYLTQALILCPTRELADQVSKELRRLARPISNIKISTLCGGTPIGLQFASLEHHPHIVVGTPGRILKHLKKGTLKLENLKTLVLDEADRMLDMGFSDDINSIIDKTPKERQSLLFSATFPLQIKKISQAMQNDPVEISVESIHDDADIKQVFYETDRNKRTDSLIALLQHYSPQSTVIFCNRKQQCKDLAEELWRSGFHAVALHGDLEQKERDQKLVQFSNKSSSILIATDVAARGLDIKDLEAVINFEISPDPEIHIHRIGRTGRAGKNGLALSLFTASEAPKVNAIEDYQKSAVNIENISALKPKQGVKIKPDMNTLCITAGRKSKIRAGDILGALTKNAQLAGKHIGKIDIFDIVSYVAVEQAFTKQALQILSEGKIKGRKYRVRKL